MELRITWDRVLRVWWSFVWRNFIAALVALLISMFAGFIIGFIMGAIGFPPRVISIVTAPLGFLIGLLISIVPMWLILGKNFGEFRLVLLARQPISLPASPAPASSPEPVSSS